MYIKLPLKWGTNHFDSTFNKKVITYSRSKKIHFFGTPGTFTVFTSSDERLISVSDITVDYLIPTSPKKTHSKGKHCMKHIFKQACVRRTFCSNSIVFVAYFSNTNFISQLILQANYKSESGIVLCTPTWREKCCL